MRNEKLSNSENGKLKPSCVTVFQSPDLSIVKRTWSYNQGMASPKSQRTITSQTNSTNLPSFKSVDKSQEIGSQMCSPLTKISKSIEKLENAMNSRPFLTKEDLQDIDEKASTTSRLAPHEETVDITTSIFTQN